MLKALYYLLSVAFRAWNFLYVDCDLNCLLTNKVQKMPFYSIVYLIHNKLNMIKLLMALNKRTYLCFRNTHYYNVRITNCLHEVQFFLNYSFQKYELLLKAYFSKENLPQQVVSQHLNTYSSGSEDKFLFQLKKKLLFLFQYSFGTLVSTSLVTLTRLVDTIV